MVLVLNREEVRGALAMSELIDAIESALVQFSLGRAIQPLRLRLFVPEQEAVMTSLPAFLAASGALGMKLVNISSRNVAEGGARSMSAMVVLSDPATAEFLAVMHGTTITELRTAAASAVATRHLARRGAAVLGVIGAGIQARSHLWALSTVMMIERVKVYDVVTERATRYKMEMENRFGLPVHVCESAEAVVRGSHVVTTVTTSRTPVLRGAWLEDGVHVNAVGACMPATRELDSEAVGRAKVVADSLEALFTDADDILVPILEGRITRDHVYGEIGEIAAGLKAGRSNPEEITIFKSLGMAVEDVATAMLVYERARRLGLGIEVDM